MSVTNIKDHLESAFLDQLESWGIDEEEAKHRGLEVKSEREVEDFIPITSRGQVKAAIPIPYWNWDGEPLIHRTVKTNGGHFIRLRMVYKPGQFGTTTDNLAKYAQEKGTDPLLYVPKPPVGGFLLDEDPKAEGYTWRDIIEDTSETIVITEGEMKAATACAYHIPTIALGGVWSWRSLKKGVTFLEQLTEIDWKQRRVILLFDSDVAIKKDVAMALNELAEMLWHKGARVFVAHLPQAIIDDDGKILKQDKIGLDDFINIAGLEPLIDIMAQAPPMTAVSQLFELNKTLCFVRSLGTVYNRESAVIYQAASLERSFANVEHQIIKYDGVDGNGDPLFKGKRANIMHEWLSWPLRMTVEDLTYEPGQDEYLTDPATRKSLVNVWRGWGCNPKPGDTKLFDELVEWMLQAHTPEERKWFWQWMAYPVQHPGAKLNSAVICQGPQGSGKTFIGTCLGKIYGTNYTKATQQMLQNDFNGFMHGKQFVLADEISGTGSAEHRRVADQLKGWVTDETIMINRKNKEQYELPNHCNFLFTTNHLDAFYLELDDRRYFIIEMPEKREQEFYDKLVAWRDSAEGPAALMARLMEIDLEGFNPSAEAPYTHHKVTMRREALTSLGEWLQDTFFDGPIVCGGAEVHADLWTADQIKTWYEAATGAKTSHKYVGQDLARLGAKRVNNGTQIKNITPTIKKARLWAVRNQLKWLNADLDQIRAHFKKHHASTEAIGQHEG